jgi:hypothetical protein
MLIKIDRSSIRPNPSAGVTETFVPGKAIIIKNNIQTECIRITHAPEPELIFNYEPVTITCSCGAIFLHSKECPICGNSQDIEYEKL